MICYEILFSSFVRDYLNAVAEPPYFMINLTNDSWYGDTAEPYQHLFLAKWRSLEFGLPILRMTNTGITSVLYPDGSESQRLLPFTKGNLDIKLVMQPRSPTLYQRVGIAGIILISFVLFGISFIFRRTILKRSQSPL